MIIWWSWTVVVHFIPANNRIYISHLILIIPNWNKIFSESQLRKYYRIWSFMKYEQKKNVSVLFLSIYNESQRGPMLFRSHWLSIYLLLCPTREWKSYRFGTTWEWVNDHTIWILIPHSFFLSQLFSTNNTILQNLPIHKGITNTERTEPWNHRRDFYVPLAFISPSFGFFQFFALSQNCSAW